VTIRIDSLIKVGSGQPLDQDDNETADWLASLGSLHRNAGAERVRFILSALDRRAKEPGVLSEAPPSHLYWNSIPLQSQPPYLGDIEVESVTADSRGVSAEVEGAKPESRSYDLAVCGQNGKQRRSRFEEDWCQMRREGIRRSRQADDDETYAIFSRSAMSREIPC
jgi:hypothetical protein